MRWLRSRKGRLPSLSGYGGTQLSERAQAAGVIDVLRKPLIRRDIAEPVAHALQARN
jgi:FixJ family two-component response regulator